MYKFTVDQQNLGFDAAKEEIEAEIPPMFQPMAEGYLTPDKILAISNKVLAAVAPTIIPTSTKGS